jgi:pSer/pThr/pTyr-binding forkhead associated (FHA) protein
MSSTRIILTMTRGPLKGSKHIFDDRRQCLIGRAPDCDIQLSLPNDPRFANISRHHCELDIDPPALRVRDLGSRNGTWLNGEMINSGSAYLENEAERRPGDFVPLKDGDEIGIGYMIVRVRIAELSEVREPVLAPAFQG